MIITRSRTDHSNLIVSNFQLLVITSQSRCVPVRIPKIYRLLAAPPLSFHSHFRTTGDATFWWNIQLWVRNSRVKFWLFFYCNAHRVSGKPCFVLCTPNCWEWEVREKYPCKRYLDPYWRGLEWGHVLRHPITRYPLYYRPKSNSASVRRRSIYSKLYVP